MQDLDNYGEMKRKEITFIDLFSGGGGLLRGFVRAGYRPKFALENWIPAIKTHERNFPGIPLITKDIRQVSESEIKKTIDKKKIDVLVGGPPCQGFSNIGSRNPKDQRNNLTLEYVRMLEIIKPKVFLMENVSGMISMKSGYYKNILIRKFRRMGYNNASYKVLNAADYGVPQLRKRVVFIGSLGNGDIVFPSPAYDKESYKIVDDAIMDLVGKEFKVSNHIPMNHNPIVKERISYIKEGGGLRKGIPGRLLRGSRSDYKKNRLENFSHIYKRLHRNKPATTMVPGHNAFPLHPTEDRALTVREAARIQTFPDSMVFEGTRQEQCILVGNAVPVKLAEALARYIKKELL